MNRGLFDDNLASLAMDYYHENKKELLKEGGNRLMPISTDYKEK